MNKKVKVFIIVLMFILLTIGFYFFIDKKNSMQETNTDFEVLKELPLPEITGGERGKLGIDKNINELNIDQYLGRTDSVYRDMRMLKDPGNYEAIGGDSYLSGYVKGFEVVSLPYLVTVTDLPKEVGETYKGETLFSINTNGSYVANYEESMSIMEDLFPKDKYIFLMCGGGGYSGMTKKLLISLGWDANKIYNVGGYWYYDGENNIEVKKIIDGKIEYDFDNVPYHEIGFNKLTKVDSDVNKAFNIIETNNNTDNDNNFEKDELLNDLNNNNVEKVTLDGVYYNKTSDEEFDIDLDLNNVRGYNIDTPEGKAEADKFLEETTQKKADIINELIRNNASFIVVVQNTDEVCVGEMLEFEVATAAMGILMENNIYEYTINLPIFKRTTLYDTVKYGPTVIIIKNGEIFKYIDANIDLFENENDLKERIEIYVEM